MQDSGLHIVVSESDSDLRCQVEDAIVFLTKEQSEISRLVQSNGIDETILDFGIDHRDDLLQQEFLCPEILRIVGQFGFGIVLSLYPHIESKGVAV